MSDYKKVLSDEEISFLKNLHIDFHSFDLQDQIQKRLDTWEVEYFEEYDNGWISKSVNWSWWWDFIYCELAKRNEKAKEKILECENSSDLISFFDEMSERYFLNYNLKIKEFRDDVVGTKKFLSLSLDEQKKMFVAMLDNNQMYVNKTEMADKKFGISEEDQNLTNQFYNSQS